ncbi:ABC transporter permease [Paenibacillus mucilaginosus]|uniref:ABC transporter permease n=2 Tax=Paenibacillus mucilaginosus TaxID=61624 RepID=I0BNA3_9BACL|nr:ABC transporter permease [Paenibacillus mucilaginosus]AEI43915.1 putative ABC transporter permease protein [Paenibacillus mucilaginosus KNP414]AFH63850.1 ABC transporter permease [Paenibacillus mucilaginosus K02]MCG7212582.1 ABC transporter permease [Paenibacillus mucilaginosus]WDM25391.1 ABC transporter permease [Paenibacillus mucilaginosus]
MRAYVSVCRMRFLNGLQYRAAALAGVATQLFFGLIFIMVYVAFYNGSTAQAPISLQDIVAYIWLQQIFLAFIMLWARDNEIFQLITGGSIAYELCRPCGIYPFWFAKLLAQRLSSALLRCFPILLIVFFLPEPYRLSLPESPGAFALFLITLALGLLLVVSVSMLIYISVFWTLSPTGSILMVSVAGEFFAGMILPIPLMPQWLQTITYVLPFRWAVDLPFRVYSGHIPADEALWGILIQLGWLAFLVGTGRLLLRRALRQVVVQGG